MVDMFWKSEVIDKLYDVWSADENVGGLVVDILEKRKKLASCTTCGPPTKRGWYGGSLFVVVGIRYSLVVRYGGRKVKLERLNSWLLVAFEILICVDIY